MAIQTSCEHCGLAYAAKESMAGRKVRCRNCGQIFTIPAPGQTPAVPNAVSAQTGAATGESSPFDALLNLPPTDPPIGQTSDSAPRATPAVRTSQSSMSGGIGSAKSMMERVGNPDAFDVADVRPESALRPSQPFTFPFAAELDRFMPPGVIWPLLLWVAYMGLFWKPDLDEGQLQPGWSGVLPMALLLLLFWAVWRSAFSIAMRMVARSFKFELPPNHKSRATALAALPFGLGTVFWFAGESIGTLVTGVVLGLAISVPAAWFLYRLKENELPYAAAGGAAAATIASVLSIGLYVGINLGLNQTLIASGSSKTFAVSPFGPDLPWPQPKALPVKVAPPPPGKTRLASEQDTGLLRQSLLQDSKLFSFERDAQQLIFAPDRDNVVAVVSQAENNRDMEIRRYTLHANGQAIPLDQQSSPFASGAPVCLSNDADFMTRLVKFMGKPTLQVWSFKEYRIIDSHSPTDWQTGEFRMVGFGPGHSLICTIQGKPSTPLFRILSVDVETGASKDWQTQPSKDQHGPMVALSRDGEKLAAIAMGKDKAKKDEPQIRVYSRDGRMPANVILPIPDSDFALNPSGLAFSPDGSMVSVAYEQSGQTSILTCPATGMGTATLAVLLGTAAPPAATPAATPPAGPRSGPPFVPPPPPPSGPSFGPRPPSPGGPRPREPEKRIEPARENQLVWLAGGDKWLYGRMIIDGGTQRSLGTIEGNAKSPVTVVRGQRIMTMAPTERGMGLLQATIVGTTTSSTPATTDAPATTEPQNP